jgi:LysM repeat protein
MAWSLLNAGCNPAASGPTPVATLTLAAADPRPSSTLALPGTVSVAITPSGPTATPFVHIVQQGETLLAIAIRYGVTLDELLLVNTGVDPRILSVGQILRIPGPGGEPIDMLLPTPTPVPLLIDRVMCYPATGELVRCLATVENRLNAAVEGVVVQISLFDTSGDLLGQSQAYNLARFLPGGQRTILEASFNVDFRDIAHAQTVLQSAVQVSNLADRSMQVELTQLQVDPRVDHRLYLFEGLAELHEGGSESQILLILQAVGYNIIGDPIGSNALQIQLDPAAFPYSFKLALFSLSGAIEDFDVLIEALPMLVVE